MSDGVSDARMRLQEALARQLQRLGMEDSASHLMAAAGGGYSPESRGTLREAIRKGRHEEVWDALAHAVDAREASACFYGLRHVQNLAESREESSCLQEPVSSDAWLSRWKGVARRHRKDRSIRKRLQSCILAWMNAFELSDQKEDARKLEKFYWKLHGKKEWSPEETEIEMAIAMSRAEAERDNATNARHEADLALALERSKMDLVTCDLESALEELRRQAKVLEQSRVTKNGSVNEEEYQRMKNKLAKKERALEEAVQEMKDIESQVQQQGVTRAQAEAVQQAVLAEVLDKLTLAQAVGLQENPQPAAGVHSMMMMEMMQRFGGGDAQAGLKSSKDQHAGKGKHPETGLQKSDETPEFGSSISMVASERNQTSSRVSQSTRIEHKIGQSQTTQGDLETAAMKGTSIPSEWPKVQSSEQKNTSARADPPADPLVLLQFVIEAGSQANCSDRPGAGTSGRPNGSAEFHENPQQQSMVAGSSAITSHPPVSSEGPDGSSSMHHPTPQSTGISPAPTGNGVGPPPLPGKGKGPPPPPPPPGKGKGPPPPPPPPGKGKGPPPPPGQGPPPAPKQVSNGGKAPLPPPLPGGGKAASGQVRRAPQVISVYQKLRRAALGAPGTRTAKVRGGGPSTPGTQFRKEDLASEIESRSAHVKAIKNDVQKHRAYIEALAKEVSNFTPKSMDDLGTFVDRLEEALGILTDERAVLKHFEWPEDRMDAFREATTQYRELRQAKRTMLTWDRGTRVAKEECQRIEKHLDKIQARIEALQRTKDADERRYISHGIPWDKSIITQVQHSSLNMGRVYLELRLQEVEKLQTGVNTKNQELLHNQLTEAVRFAFRLHQFASGFDDDCLQLFDRIQNIFQELIDSEDKSA